MTPAPVAHASQLFSAAEAPFIRKNTRFRANPNIQITSLIRENEAFARGFLQIPRVEEMNDLYRHVPTELNDLFRHVPTGLKDLRRHVPTGLKDL